MNFPFNDKELDRILRANVEIRNLDHLMEDAKWRLSQARLHSPIVSAVTDQIAHLAHYEGRHYWDDDIYAVLALQLLRENSAYMKKLLSSYSMAIDLPVITWTTCPKPHHEPKTWWQRVCWKLGGFK